MSDSENDDYIRPPDAIIAERLIDSISDIEDESNYINEEYLDDVLNKSLEEYQQTEKDVFESYNNELNKRKIETESIISKFKKLSIYDSSIKNILDIKY
jgi:hypothetical protein